MPSLVFILVVLYVLLGDNVCIYGRRVHGRIHRLSRSTSKSNRHGGTLSPGTHRSSTHNERQRQPKPQGVQSTPQTSNTDNGHHSLLELYKLGKTSSTTSSSTATDVPMISSLKLLNPKFVYSDINSPPAWLIPTKPQPPGIPKTRPPPVLRMIPPPPPNWGQHYNQPSPYGEPPSSPSQWIPWSAYYPHDTLDTPPPHN